MDNECIISFQDFGLQYTAQAEPTLHHINLDIHKGEVVGIAGLLGSGRSELARVIYGADRNQSGSLKVDGKEAKIKSPMDAVNQTKSRRNC